MKISMEDFGDKFIVVKYPHDLYIIIPAVVVDASHPLLSVSNADHLASGIVYCGDVSWIKGTILGGE